MLAGATGLGGAAGAAPLSTLNIVWHREQRTFAPRGPILSSGTRNFAWHFVQMTIIREAQSAEITPRCRLTPSGKDKTMPGLRALIPPDGPDERREHPR